MVPVRLVLLALAVVALAAGCGGDDDAGTTVTEPPRVEPIETDGAETATETDAAAETASCDNPEAGYRVEYPADWHVNDEEGPGEPCSWFDPEPFEVPEATEFFGAAVSISREPVAAEVIVEQADLGREVLSREETEVAGQRAFRIESESTGEALLDAGVRYYQVVVVVDGESLILSTYDLPEHDYERNREVLDEMASTLELTR